MPSHLCGMPPSLRTCQSAPSLSAVPPRGTAPLAACVSPHSQWRWSWQTPGPGAARWSAALPGVSPASGMSAGRAPPAPGSEPSAPAPLSGPPAVAVGRTQDRSEVDIWCACVRMCVCVCARASGVCIYWCKLLTGFSTADLASLSRAAGIVAEKSRTCLGRGEAVTAIRTCMQGGRHRLQQVSMHIPSTHLRHPLCPSVLLHLLHPPILSPPPLCPPP